MPVLVHRSFSVRNKASEAAKKAWITRRRKAAEKLLAKPLNTVVKPVPKTTPQSEAAKKAWETRRQNEKDEAERLEAIRILDELAAQRESSEG